MMNYAFIALITVAVSGVGFGAWQVKRNETMQAEKAVLSGQLVSCGGRLQNLIEDVRSDNEIDNLPDDALRTVPPEWLRPSVADPG